MPALPAYLLDTNHACAFMSEQQPLSRANNMLHLKNLLARIAVLDFNDSVAEQYGQLQAEQKAKGRPIPSSDAQIAATARIYDLVLLSADHHMRQIDSLLVENWM